MKITKYAHACLLLEQNDKKLLIDPGGFTFTEAFSPAQMGPVDAILITHEHFDHLSVDAIKAFSAMRPVTLVAGAEVRTLLEKEGLTADTIPAGQSRDLHGFTVETFAAAHEAMPGSAAENIAYYINGSLLHPGDSYHTAGLPHPEILALPTQGPWARVVDTLEFARSLKPAVAIPIHNALLNEGIGQMFDRMIGEQLKQDGIELRELTLGQAWEIETVQK